MKSNKMRCPACKARGDSVDDCRGTRIHRKKWMRLLPLSRYYMCDRCSSKYLSIGGLFSITVSS